MEEYVDLYLRSDSMGLVKKPWDPWHDHWSFEVDGEHVAVCISHAEAARWPEFEEGVAAVLEERRILEEAEWKAYLAQRHCRNLHDHED